MPRWVRGACGSFGTTVWMNTFVLILIIGMFVPGLAQDIIRPFTIILGR